MRIRSLRAAAVVGGTIVVAAVVGALVQPPPGFASQRLVLCGVERWAIKTLKDRPALVPARLVTVRYLTTRPAPAHLPATRLPFERRVFTVFAQVKLVRAEDDGDFHLVLQAGSAHMIAEAPMTACTGGAKPALRRAMTIARSHVRVCRRAKITGVAFFDFDHGQTGVAPNAIELHPILGIHCLAA